jgi:hypothetical protein
MVTLLIMVTYRNCKLLSLTVTLRPTQKTILFLIQDMSDVSRFFSHPAEVEVKSALLSSFHQAVTYLNSKLYPV